MVCRSEKEARGTWPENDLTIDCDLLLKNSFYSTCTSIFDDK